VAKLAAGALGPDGCGHAYRGVYLGALLGGGTGIAVARPAAMTVFDPVLRGHMRGSSIVLSAEVTA